MNVLIPIIQREGVLVADSRAVATALEIQHGTILVNLDTQPATPEARG